MSFIITDYTEHLSVGRLYDALNALAEIKHTLREQPSVVEKALEDYLSGKRSSVLKAISDSIYFEQEMYGMDLNVRMTKVFREIASIHKIQLPREFYFSVENQAIYYVSEIDGRYRDVHLNFRDKLRNEWTTISKDDFYSDSEYVVQKMDGTRGVHDSEQVKIAYAIIMLQENEHYRNIFFGIRKKYLKLKNCPDRFKVDTVCRKIISKREHTQHWINLDHPAKNALMNNLAYQRMDARSTKRWMNEVQNVFNQTRPNNYCRYFSVPDRAKDRQSVLDNLVSDILSFNASKHDI